MLQWEKNLTEFECQCIGANVFLSIHTCICRQKVHRKFICHFYFEGKPFTILSQFGDHDKKKTLISVRLDNLVEQLSVN